jgi:hypothetical protein
MDVLDRPVDQVAQRRIGGDSGFAGTVTQLTVRARGHADLTLVAKVGPDPMLDREVAFYRDLAGSLEAPTPGCWYAGPAADGTPVVLLEDLTGARQGDALTGASVDDVAAVLACMAPLWRRPALGSLPRWGSDPVRRQERFRTQWGRLREPLSNELPHETWLIGERLCDSLAAIATDLMRAPACVVHCDLHLDNVVFDSAAAPARPVVLDWGSTSGGPSVIDVYPFLAMSLSLEDHTRHAAALLSELGLDHVTLDDGRRSLLCYFAGNVGWRSRPPVAHPRETALRTAALGDGRLVNALQQWETASIL